MRKLVYFRDLMRELVRRDILIRYKRSVLGILWSLLNPLLQLAVFFFVFRWIVPVSVENYALFLFVGILVWNWFQSSVQLGSSVITDNSVLIRQPGFPVAILPPVAVTANLVNLLLAFPVLVAALLLAGVSWSAWWFALPLIVGIQFLLTLAIVYTVATMHVSFRDTQYLLGLLLLFGFYLSPVFYAAGAVPPEYAFWYRLNPLVPLLESYREILLHGRQPEFAPLAKVAAGSVFLLILAYRGFDRASHQFAEEL